jgi:tetratricopeptide (TPR) repeat protein
MRAILAILLVSTAALADAPQEAREHFNNAQTHYALGEFEQAIAEYREAYRLRHEPAILFNIAQSQRQLAQWRSAHFYYRQYLAQKPDAPNRSEVEQLIAQMRRKIEQEEDSERLRLEREGTHVAPARSPEERLAEELHAQRAAAAPIRAPLPSQAVAAPPPQPPRTLRYAGYAAAGAGVAVAVAGIVFHSSAQSAADEFNRKYADRTLTAADAQLKSDAQARSRLATIAFVSGAALLAAGGVLTFAF